MSRRRSESTALSRGGALLALLAPLLVAAAAFQTPATHPTPEPPLARPPQFVVMSFDGAGSVDLWKRWRAVAKDTGAHFTFFVSGVYLLEPEHRNVYMPPDRLRGHSAIGFLPVPKGEKPEKTLRALLAQIDEAHAEGHEIGTHFNGHWCGDGGVADWDAEDWREEVDEFRRLLRDVNANNGLVPPVTMVVGSAMIVGARTPCLEGDRRELEAALASTGFRYDASRPGQRDEWPRRENGVWSFSVPPLELPGSTHPVLATDYNLYARQSGATAAEPERAADFEKETYDALVASFEQSYYGRRAPFVVSSHFEHWNHEAYAHAIRKFLRNVCSRPEVRCESFTTLADWLDAIPEDDFERLRRGEFPRMHRGAVADRRPAPAH